MVGPSAQCSVSASPSRPRIPMRDSAPVPKSKPVAHTMMSNSRTPSVVSMPGLGQPHDRRLPEIDERHLRIVERLEVPGDERRPLLTEPMVRGDQPLGGLRVVHDAADLAGDELAPLGVGGLVEQQVGVVAGELHEAGAVPHLLVEGPPLLGRVVERGALVHRVGEAADRGVEDLAQVLEVGPQLRPARPAVIGVLLSGVHQLAVRWYTVSSATSSRIVGDDLHAARRGADDRDALAGEVDRLGRPPAGVVRLAPEVVTPGHVGEVRNRQHAGGRDEEPGPDRGAVAERDRPGARRLVEDRRGDPGVEADVAAEVEPVDHVVEVALGLGLGREVLLPLPLVEQLLGEQVAVGVALGVEAGARVAVPVPGAARRRRRPRPAGRRSRPRRAR